MTNWWFCYDVRRVSPFLLCSLSGEPHPSRSSSGVSWARPARRRAAAPTRSAWSPRGSSRCGPACRPPASRCRRRARRTTSEEGQSEVEVTRRNEHAWNRRSDKNAPSESSLLSRFQPWQPHPLSRSPHSFLAPSTPWPSSTQPRGARSLRCVCCEMLTLYLSCIELCLLSLSVLHCCHAHVRNRHSSQHNSLSFQSHLFSDLSHSRLYLSHSLALCFSLSFCRCSGALRAAGHLPVRIRQPRRCRLDWSLDCRRCVVRSFIRRRAIFLFSMFGNLSCTVSCCILVAWCLKRASTGAFVARLLQNVVTQQTFTFSILPTYPSNGFPETLKNTGAFC